MTFYLHVDRPSTQIIGRTFTETVVLVAQPTYGRILFRDHNALIASCTFRPMDVALDLRGVTQ